MYMFSPACCCGGGYKNLIIICIYDESSTIYHPSSVTYDAHMILWDQFIDGLKVSNVRMGCLIPQRTVFWPPIKPDHRSYPKDSHRSMIDVVTLVRDQIPRLLASDIVDLFNLIRTRPNDFNGANGPDLLLFCLDNSGSIIVNSYQAELDAAKAQLQLEWPDMDFLDDVSNAGEMWLRDARVGAATKVIR